MSDLEKLDEKIDHLMSEMAKVMQELIRTQTIVRDYNELREKIADHDIQLSVLAATAVQKRGFISGVRDWGSWAVAIAAVLVAWYKR